MGKFLDAKAVMVTALALVLSGIAFVSGWWWTEHRRAAPLAIETIESPATARTDSPAAVPPQARSDTLNASFAATAVEPAAGGPGASPSGAPPAPVTPGPGEAGNILGKALVAKDEAAKMALQGELVTKFPGSIEAFTVAEETAEYFLKRGEDYLARNAFSVAYLQTHPQVRKPRWKEQLDELNGRLIFSSRPSPDGEMYAVQPGDALEKIAQKYNCPVLLIKRLNGIPDDSDMIRAGEKLKVVKGEFRVAVKKADFTLLVLLHGHYVKEYKVGIGKDGRTPTAAFTVRTKVQNPDWYFQGKRVPYGDPANILGTRWLGFDKGVYAGFGIHGTAEPDSIGKASSLGCIRMLNADVEDLFTMIPYGTPVDVTD